MFFRWPIPTGALRAALLVFLSLAPAGAGRCGEDGSSPLDLAAEVDRVESAIASGGAREAIDRLKPLVRGHPDRPALARLLAKAYLADGNPFWAERTLAAALANDPGDWESRSWLAWVQLSQGDPELARKTLEAGPAPAAEPGTVRVALLAGMIAHTSGDPEGSLEAISPVSGARTMFEEDRALWDHLWRQQPGWFPPLSVRTEFALGYTSNSTAGSPMDPGVTGNPGPLANLNVFTRLVLPRQGAARAALDFSLRGHGVGDEEARDLSYLEFSLRPAVLIGRRRPLLLGYRAERMLVNDQPSRFYDAHRLEAEFDRAGVSFLLAAGKRTYSNPRRTRYELEGGFGGSVRLPREARLLVAGSVRLYDAQNPAYDQRGATAVAAVRWPAGHGLRGRIALTFSYDNYPHSGGDAGWEVYQSEEKRTDLLGRASFGMWKDIKGSSVGIRYQYAQRNSTIDTAWGSNYSYTEHRATFVVRWRAAYDPWAPRPVRPPGHVGLEYGIGGAGDLHEERIQDLLRQDEQLRQASGCPNLP